MTLTQLALVAGAATVMAGWCLRRAMQFGPATVATTYLRYNGEPFTQTRTTWELAQLGQASDHYIARSNTSNPDFS